MRILEAPEPRGAYLHLHGGGWTIGAGDLQDPALWELAQATGLTAVSVDYRLAPEHPYPAGPDDCEDAALWLLAHHEGRLTIGGDSAGAHLAVVTLLRLRDRHGISPRAFAAANLVFGSYDLTGTPGRLLWGERELVLSGPLMDWFADCFLPGMSADERRSPDVSPLYADLRDLPPALFSCGTLDPLLDDSLFMEARWRAAGNESRLACGTRGARLHGVPARDRPPLARRAARVPARPSGGIALAGAHGHRRAGSRAARAGTPSAGRTRTTGCRRS